MALATQLAALKAPPDASAGQRPGLQEQTNVARPERAQESSAPSGRMEKLGAVPGALPRAGYLRAVGATRHRCFQLSIGENRDKSISQIDPSPIAIRATFGAGNWCPLHRRIV